MADSTGRRLFRRRPASGRPEAEKQDPDRGIGGVPSEVPVSLSPPVRPVRPLEPSGEEVPADAAGTLRVSEVRGERTVTVAVRLTPAEHARWAAAAAAGGRSQMGRWVRETVTARLDGRPTAAPGGAETAGELASLRGELSKVGSNLNQIARALNVQAKGGPVQVDPAQMVRVLTELKVELGLVREELAERSWR